MKCNEKRQRLRFRVKSTVIYVLLITYAQLGSPQIVPANPFKFMLFFSMFSHSSVKSSYF